MEEVTYLPVCRAQDDLSIWGLRMLVLYPPSGQDYYCLAPFFTRLLSEFRLYVHYTALHGLLDILQTLLRILVFDT